MQKKCLKLFLDEGVPDSVGREFKNAGHEVIFLRESLKTGSADDVVCAAALANDAILVACDGDMKQKVKKFGISNSRFADLNLIQISVKSAPQATPRVREAMSLIEHEWAYARNKSARRMFIEIKTSLIRTIR